MSETGLYFRTSASDSRLAWDLITGWAEVERVFALFPSPVLYFPVPKRAMTELHRMSSELFSRTTSREENDSGNKHRVRS